MINHKTAVAAATSQNRNILCSLCLACAYLSAGAAVQSAPRAELGRSTSELTASAIGRDGAVLRQYRSKHFLLHTDLANNQAHELMASMESVIGFATEYWRRPCPNVIECYVAQDMSAWPDAALPHRLARITMAKIGGATITVPSSSGTGRLQNAMFFARAGELIAEHESVHAYCLQAFGQTGPTWYKEGMAEVGCRCGNKPAEAIAPQKHLDYVLLAPRRTIREIVSQGRSTSGLSQILREILAKQDAENRQRQVSLSLWTEADANKVRRARELYCWNWSLCHFLCHNPNYALRFRHLGQSYLTGQGKSFANLFADVADQMEFEYDFFRQRLGVGYRVDLASWDWSARPKKLRRRQHSKVKVLADRGFQATSVFVTKGTRYRYQCQGEWRVDPNDEPSNASGGATGRGRLIGVVQKDFELSEPFLLGQSGVFTPPVDGHLYVRCKDKWTELADNSGSILVTVCLEWSARNTDAGVGSF